MPISSIKFQVNENFNLTIGMSQTNIPYFMVVGNGGYAYKDGVYRHWMAGRKDRFNTG